MLQHPTRFRPALVLAALSMCVPLPSAMANPVAPSLWGADASGHLYEIYVVRHVNSPPSGFATMGPGCAFAEFAAVLTTGMTVDLTTGMGTAVGVAGTASGPHAPWGIAFSPMNWSSPCASTDGGGITHTFTALIPIGSGMILGAYPATPCQSSTLCTYDPATRVVNDVGTCTAGEVTGLAQDPLTHRYFATTTCDDGTPSRLLSIDLPGGAATVIGSTGVTLSSIAFSYGVSDDGVYLFGAGDARDGGNLYVIDTATGAARSIGGPTNIAMVGLCPTMFGLIVPTRGTSWGRVKTTYR